MKVQTQTNKTMKTAINISLVAAGLTAILVIGAKFIMEVIKYNPNIF